MKKILFATTALVASTSFAMADVDLSGSAEMGVFAGSGIDEGTTDDLQFHSDIDIDFSMSGETDGGLTFGASIDLDSTRAGSNAFDNSEPGSDTSIFVSGALGTLTMGDTDGALDWAMQEAIIGGTLNDDHEHAGYNGNSLLDGFNDLEGQVARYDYSFGDFAVALSAEVEGDDEDGSDDTFGVGATYDGTFGGVSYGVGLGYQENEDSSAIGVSMDLSLDSGLRAIVNYTDFDDVFTNGRGDFDFVDEFGIEVFAEVESHVGLAVGYQFGALLLAANYGEFDLDGGDVSGIGLVANYDLGGGAELQAGYAYNDLDSDVDGEDDDYDTYSFGISMSF